MSRSRSRSRSLFSLVVAGVVLGVFTLSPVAAHFSQNTKHLGRHAWRDVIRKKVYNKRQANRRFVNTKEHATLPPGETASGNWGLSGYTTNDVQAFFFANISFGYELAAAPTAHWIAPGDSPTAECPGSPDNPQAEPGHFCMYEEDNLGLLPADPRRMFFVTRWGATPYGRTLLGTDVVAWAYGTWAVTAPLPGAAPMSRADVTEVDPNPDSPEAARHDPAE